QLKELDYYPVGGCGSNIAWHTENDTLEIADKDNLMRDLRVYVATLQRVVNNALYPFDFRKLAAEFQQTLDKYNAGACGEVDFAPTFDALKQLTSALDTLYSKGSSLIGKSVTDPAVKAYNDAILELGRILVPINYTRQGLFRTEPAVKILPLPDLAPAVDYSGTSGHMRHVTRTHLVRGVNRVAWAFESAAKAVQRALAQIG
ncbi:MAG: peptidase M28, partial [Anaerolineae bacterium]|nr:peptidase M28 [Anaerolineae bacterium]